MFLMPGLSRQCTGVTCSRSRPGPALGDVSTRCSHEEPSSHQLSSGHWAVQSVEWPGYWRRPVTSVTRAIGSTCDCVRLRPELIVNWSCYTLCDLILGRDMNCNRISCAEYIKFYNTTPSCCHTAHSDNISQHRLELLRQPLDFLSAAHSELNGVISLCCSQLKRHEPRPEIHISALVMDRVRSEENSLRKFIQTSYIKHFCNFLSFLLDKCYLIFKKLHNFKF